MESKEVFVKAHVRIIRQKVYRFVCKECNQVSERICFPSQPLYCDRCRPPKGSKSAKVSPAVAAAAKESKKSARKKSSSATRRKRTNSA